MAPNKRGVNYRELFDYRANEGQRSLMSRRELPAMMKASIRLSNQLTNIVINSIIDSIRQELPDFECDWRGDVLVVSGDPPRNGFVAGDILAIVRRHDHHAAIIN